MIIKNIPVQLLYDKLQGLIIMVIHAPKLEESNDSNNIRINFSIDSDNFNNVLWYEVENKYEELLSQSCDSALIALLVPAMHINEDIYIDGTVSEKLIFNLYRLQKILQNLIPSLHIISITYKETTTFKYNSKYIALGFSGGIDSYATLDDYYYNCKLDNHKITHLTYHNVGNHTIGKFDTDFNLQKELFEDRFEKINKIVSKLSGTRIPFIKIDSNIELFYDPKYLHIGKTYTIRNISVALLLQKDIRNFYFSSAYSYKNLHIESIIIPLFSTESLDATLVGAEYTRVEKTLKVAKLKDAQLSLDVCIDSEDGVNCSKCFKCMRTQLTLDLAGKLKDFSAAFDLEVYEQNKEDYINKLILDLNSFSSEILAYAKGLDENYGSIDLNTLFEAKATFSDIIDEHLNTELIYKKAINYQYNKDYKNAVSLYKLVLFLDPLHRTAKQYLDLLERKLVV